ncbi:hypothetical protein EV715DRAFT_296985 [Schizophyllum commune]
MDRTFYSRCRAVVAAFIAGDHTVRLSMIKNSLDLFLLFARHTAPQDDFLREMLVAVASGIQDRYANDVHNAAIVYLAERQNGFEAADLSPRKAGEDVHDHGRLEDAELMAHAVGYPVHELKDLFVELGVPEKPRYPPGVVGERANCLQARESASDEHAGGPTSAGPQARQAEHPPIHNFCRVVIGQSSGNRTPSPSISDQERECDGVDIRQTLPGYQAQLVHNINTSVQSLINSTNNVNATLSRLDGLHYSLQLARTQMQVLVDSLPGPASRP